MKVFSSIFLIVGLLLFTGMLIGTNLSSNDINDAYKIRGKYDPNLKHLSDANALNAFVSNEQERLNIQALDTLAIVVILDSILQMRFYHGTSRYNPNENWVAFIMGELLWDDFRMMVIPDQILKNKVVVCNQMTIVFQEVLSKRNIRFRAVGLNRHMVTEVKTENSWHVFDPDYEPALDHKVSMDDLISDSSNFRSKYKATSGASFNHGFEELLHTKELDYYPENKKLASRLRMYQILTGYFASYAWIIFFGLSLLFFKLGI